MHRVLRMCGLGLLVSGWSLGLCLTHAIAQTPPPAVRVQAHTHLQLKVEAGPPQGLIAHLTDEHGSPLAGREVQFELQFAEANPRQVTLKTDNHGKALFRAATTSPRPVAARIHFAGGPYYLSSYATVDLNALAPTTTVTWSPSDRTLDLGQATQQIQLQLHAKVESGPVRAELEYGTPPITQHGRQPQPAHRPQTFELESASLQLGEQALRASFYRADGGLITRASRIYLGKLQPALSLTLHLTATSDRLRAQGRLQSPRGPLPGRTVEVGHTDQWTPIRTDDEGHFNVQLAAPEAGVTLRARFTSDEPGLFSARSAPVSWQRRDTRQPLFWTAALWLTGALVWLALRWARRPKSAPLPRASSPAAPQPSMRTSPLADPPKALASPRYGSIQGHVIDAESAAPIADAHLQILHQEQHAWAGSTDAKGRFASPQLAAGEYTLCVRTAHHAPYRLTVRCPHNGELSELVVSLQSTRAAIWHSFHLAVRNLSIPDRPALPMTPRALARWSEARHNFPLRELALAVEQALFGQRAPSPDPATRLQTALQHVAGKATTPENEKPHTSGR